MERIPSPASGGRGTHEKNARIFFMGTREGGRRPEGGNTNPAFTPLGGRPKTQHLPRLAAAQKPSVYPAWRPPANPAFIPLGALPFPRTLVLSRLARAQARSLHEKIPSPACGGRGSHEKNARIFFMGAREGGRRPEGGNTNPAFIPLGGPLSLFRIRRGSRWRYRRFCRPRRRSLPR